MPLLGGLLTANATPGAPGATTGAPAVMGGGVPALSGAATPTAAAVTPPPAAILLAPYLRPLMAPVLGPAGSTPVANAMLSVLDTGVADMGATLAQARLDHDPRAATGGSLRQLARRWGLDLLPGEDDEGLRRRLLAGPQADPTTKAAIAAAVTALAGVPATVVTDQPGHFIVALFANSPASGQIMPLVRRMKAAGMQPQGQMLVGRPGTSRLGQVRLGQGTLGGASTMAPLPDPTAPAPATVVVLVNTPQRPYNAARPMGRALLGKTALGAVTLGH